MGGLDSELGSQRGGQAWWLLHLRGDVDSIILNARVPFVSGETEARASFTVYDIGRARTTEVLQTLIGPQPLWNEAISLLLCLCHPRWISRQLTFLSHLANSNSILF